MTHENSTPAPVVVDLIQNESARFRPRADAVQIPDLFAGKRVYDPVIPQSAHRRIWKRRIGGMNGELDLVFISDRNQLTVNNAELLPPFFQLLK